MNPNIVIYPENCGLRKSLKLTPANARQYIGHEIQFKTRGNLLVKRILGVSETGLSIIIDHPDLKNNLQIVTRNVYVLTGEDSISECVS